MAARDFRVLADGGVTAPQGFLAGAVYAGLQQPLPGQLDLGALVSDRPCVRRRASRPIAWLRRQ